MSSGGVDSARGPSAGEHFANGSGRLPDRSQHPELPWFDVNGDGFLAPGDCVIIINALNAGYEQPSLSIKLVNDTARVGSTKGDQITSDARTAGTITDSRGNVDRLTGQIDGGERVDLSVENGTSFSFDPLLATDGCDDGEHVLRVTAFDGLVIVNGR